MSINSKFAIAENLSGLVKAKNNKININIIDGESIIYNNFYLNFKDTNLAASILFTPFTLKAQLKNLFSLQLKKNSGYSVELRSDNLRNIKQFIINSIDINWLNDLKLKGKQNISLAAQISKNGAKIEANIFVKRVSYRNIKLNDSVIRLPILINVNGKENGLIKTKIDINRYEAFLNIKAEAINNRLSFNIVPQKTRNFYLKPFDITINVKDKTIKSTKLNAIMNTKIGKIFSNFYIDVKNNTAKLPGYITIKAFDGEAILKNMRAKLKPILVFHSNIVFSHINLAKITQKTKFGLITGFIKGHINNLELVNFKYPLRFDAIIKTQNVKGASQRISLKAVNSISKVGGGLASVAVPFFKSFPYSKIGIRLTLKNDMFSLHGLYKSGNKEYLIKKGFLIGVDVINMNKSNKIPFNDLINRVKRVIGGKHEKK